LLCLSLGIRFRGKPVGNGLLEEEDDSDVRTIGIVDLSVISARPRKPSLVVVSGVSEGATSSNRVFPVAGEKVIGRGEVDIKLEMKGVSRSHAKVLVTGDGEVQIEDLGATNGVFVNGKRVESAVLADGDRIQLGSALLVMISLEDQAPEALDQSPTNWTPDSWRNYPAANQPPYRDPAALEAVLSRLRTYPPLVAMGEVEQLKTQLAEARAGKRFILQGGDCAERFADCNSMAVLRKLKILAQMSLVLSYGARRPVTCIGRIAGQYAKPRSKSMETIGGVSLPSFFGDNVNDMPFTPEAREPLPARLEQGYFLAASTLNFIRALMRAGFIDLGAPEHWQLDFIPSDTGVQTPYRDIAHTIQDAIAYLRSIGHSIDEFRNSEIFSSHEALLLPFEEALTRRSRDGGPYYNLGAHFLWIGERTRQLDGAHIEYARGIANPIGVKIGPNCHPDELAGLIEKLNPRDEPGRLTLVTRLGASKVSELLPPLVRAARATGRANNVIWMCDPMHGNIKTMQGVKTRDFQDIIGELTATFDVHRNELSRLAGVHFELTGENVTECVGGLVGLGIEDLNRFYATGCDPRLNYGQSMEVAFLLADLLRV
jgi:3-deoxy-7-phosphoheptulonate synthase